MNDISTEPAASPRQTILAAATTLFGERDYPAVSIRDIARAVGMLPGSIYAFVTSKQAMLHEIVDVGIREFLAAVDSIDAGLTPGERLRQAVAAHLSLVAGNPERALVVFHQWRFLGESARADVVASRRRYEMYYREIISDGVQSGAFRADLNIRFATLAVLGALNWAPEWVAPTGLELAPTDVPIADFLLAALAAGYPQTPTVEQLFVGQTCNLHVDE
ncbi:TetR/AcrR family transcriptional regulator [Nocardia sp. NPDC004123]